MDMRIADHPILGPAPQGRAVRFTFDGKEAWGLEGEPVAAALRAAGVMAHRYTKKRGEPRGVFCAIGRCTDCVMVVNGSPNVRTCVTPLEEGMAVETGRYGAVGAGAARAEAMTSTAAAVTAAAEGGAGA
jgi:predicted molibdopterin-dependent oxidoreductase YjgC